MWGREGVALGNVVKMLYKLFQHLSLSQLSVFPPVCSFPFFFFHIGIRETFFVSVWKQMSHPAAPQTIFFKKGHLCRYKHRAWNDRDWHPVRATEMRISPGPACHLDPGQGEEWVAVIIPCCIFGLYIFSGITQTAT